MSKNKYERDLHDSDIVDNMKINSKDFFELVYLRHCYFRKSKNPSPKRLKQFEQTICNISNKFYFKNIKVFEQLGFGLDDIKNISRVHTVSFLSISGFKENPEKISLFIKEHKKKYGQHSEPTKLDFFKKECYNLSRFLRQRLTEVVRFSKLKCKNIRGTADQKAFFKGKTGKDPSDIDLIQNPHAYGFEKIKKIEYEEILKKCNTKNKSKFKDNEGNVIRSVCIKGKVLTKDCIKNTYIDPRCNGNYSSPEDILIDIEENNIKYLEMINILTKK